MHIRIIVFNKPLHCLLLLTGLLLTLSGCNDFAAAVRQVTYPPDFRYVSDAELRSSMNMLAYQLQQLDEALTVADPDVPDQEVVVDSLRQIERISSQLQAGDAGASHPFLENDMPAFVSQVNRARLAAAQDPPRYYFAGRIVGACAGCHRINR